MFIPSADGGIAVLGNLLVGLLGGSAGGLLDSLGDVVGTLLEGIHCQRSLVGNFNVKRVIVLFNW